MARATPTTPPTSTMSWQARAFVLGMRALRLKQRLFGDARAIAATIARDRKKGPDAPSAKMRGRFTITDSVVDGRHVTVVAPKDKPARRTILYLHGGGFVMAIVSLHWLLIARLAHRLDAVVVVPDYPLAPEHDVVGVNAWLVNYWRGFVRGHDVGSVHVMGDSAGGHLALALAMQARDAGLPLPASLTLFSPALTGDHDHATRRALDATDVMIALSGMPPIIELYAPGVDHDDPRVNLLKGSLRGLPPMAVFAGTKEIMHYDLTKLVEKAAEENVDVDVFAYEGMFHAWPIFPIPEARRAVEDVIGFVQKHETTKTT
jgi:acetyl esterase/lipase